MYKNQINFRKKSKSELFKNYPPTRWFSKSPKYGGNAKRLGFTIDNRNALKKHTQVEEVLGSEQTRHNAFFANDVILVQVQVTDFNF